MGSKNIAYHDLAGKRFGSILVLYRIENKVYKGNREFVQWLCECDCGKIIKVTTISLTSKNSKSSCGCKTERKPQKIRKHGKTNTRLFTIWGSMKDRCYNKNHMGYPRYGGIGILICEEWMDKDFGFINFYNWAMDNGYSDELSIDRIDGSKSYFPENCRWATHKEQQNNTSNNIRIEHDGIIKTISEWKEALNITSNSRTPYDRYRRGERDFDKLFGPPDPIKSSNARGKKNKD